ncbi:hypothetical protein ACMFMF_009063 [Clarireedia jacksonii]
MLVCVLAVLGVGEEGWKGLFNYPPILSAIIKLVRFMVVQQAWQIARSREEEGEEEGPGCAILVKRIMDTFMIKGTYTAMDWMLDLRTYGLKIHYNTTGQGHVEWVGEQIRFKKIEFTMQQLKVTVGERVREAREVLVRKVLGIKREQELPRIPWAHIRDDPTRSTRAWNFVRDERNSWPVDGDWWLLDRWAQGQKQQALLKDTQQGRGRGRGGGIWDKRGIEQWIRVVVELREKLLFLMDITGGQPARGPEILSIRYANTTNGEHRNIFIEDGMGDVKIIYRYLPRAVGEVLVYYLWLVVPLQQRLQAELQAKETWSDYMWPKHDEEK